MRWRPLPGATSSEIASAAGLNERYVREWLGGMVSADIVEYEPQSKTYTVPAHHLPALTRAGGLDNVARMTQHIAQLGEVEQDIIGCFRNGGGLDYSRFPRFHALRAEEVREIFDNAVVDKILPLADDLPARLRAGIDIADFGCGSGHAINLLAKTFPESRCTGYDFSTEALRTGQAEAAELGLSNVTFKAQDLAQLDIAEAFDAILVFDAIHDQAQPGQGAGQHPSGPSARRGAPDGGRQGIEQPRGQPGHPLGLLAVHRLDDALHDGVTVRRRRGLGTAWGEQLAVSMLGDAGFPRCRWPASTSTRSTTTTSRASELISTGALRRPHPPLRRSGHQLQHVGFDARRNLGEWCLERLHVTVRGQAEAKCRRLTRGQAEGRGDGTAVGVHRAILAVSRPLLSASQITDSEFSAAVRCSYRVKARSSRAPYEQDMTSSRCPDRA